MRVSRKVHEGRHCRNNVKMIKLFSAKKLWLQLSDTQTRSKFNICFQLWSLSII